MLSASADKDEIFRKVKTGFSDYALFDKLVASKLRDAIKDAEGIEITFKNTEKVAERYFDVKSFTTPEQRLALSSIELIFKTAYTLILSHRPDNKQHIWLDTSTLLQHYPEFISADPHELNLLLRYRNAVKIALLVIPPRRNKALIMKIAERLEGSQKDYITGGGQSTDVKRRVSIYEREGNIIAEKRPPRERKPKNRLPGFEKNPVSTFSVKRAKMVRLASDETTATLPKTSADVLFNSQARTAPLPAPPAIIESSSSTSISLPKEPLWSPLTELSAVASSMPFVSSLPTASLPVLSSFGSRENSLATASLGPQLLNRTFSDNLSMFLAISDPEYFKNTYGDVAMDLPQPAPMVRPEHLTAEGEMMMQPLGPSTLQPLGKGKGRKNGGVLSLPPEFSLGFSSGALAPDLKADLQRTGMARELSTESSSSVGSRKKGPGKVAVKAEKAAPVR